VATVAQSVDPGCNIIFPCEGVAPSPRGLRVVKAMGGFGSAKLRYEAPAPHVSFASSSIGRPSRYIAGHLICAINVGVALAERGIKGSTIHVLAALTRLRQICCHPHLGGDDDASGKTETLFELLDPLVADGQKVLVFSQFVQMLQILESRLDNVVFHLGFANTRAAARQMVGHGHIAVNGRKASIPSYALKVNDVVSVKNNNVSRQLATKGLEVAASRAVPDWLSLNKEELKGTVMRTVTEELQRDDGHDLSLLDGIKVFYKGGWAQILPDADEALFHVYAEGVDSDASEQMADGFVARVRAVIAAKTD